jgi:hypothetical protein
LLGVTMRAAFASLLFCAVSARHYFFPLFFHLSLLLADSTKLQQPGTKRNIVECMDDAQPVCVEIVTARKNEEMCALCSLPVTFIDVTGAPGETRESLGSK